MESCINCKYFNETKVLQTKDKQRIEGKCINKNSLFYEITVPSTSACLSFKRKIK